MNRHLTRAEVPPLEHGFCPHCGASMDGGGIWDHFFNEFQTKGHWLDADGKYLPGDRRILSAEEAATTADDVAESYGATRTKGRWGRAIGLIVNDRLAEYRCPDCEQDWMP